MSGTTYNHEGQATTGANCYTSVVNNPTKRFVPKQTVGDLIKKLQEFPQDMPVAVYYFPFDEITVKKVTWTHDNYPYDQPSFDFVDLE